MSKPRAPVSPDALPGDLPDVESQPLPRSAEGERLLDLGARAVPQPAPMVRLDRARVSPADEDLEAVESWARASGRWSTVVEVLALRARTRLDAERVDVYLEAASLAREKLRRYDLALQLAEAARGPRASVATLTLLAELYELAGRPVDAAGAIEQLLQEERVPREKLSAVTRTLARLARQGDPAFAVIALRRASSLDRSSRELRVELVRALVAAKDAWPPHSTALPPSDVEIASEEADLAQRGSLTDPATVDRLRRSLALREDPDLRDALYRALLAERRFGDLERELSAQVRGALPSARVEVLRRMGELASKPPWSRLDLAREAYGSALALQPDDEVSFSWLFEDARGRGDWDRVELLFRRLVGAMHSRPAADRNRIRHRALAFWRDRARDGDAAGAGRLCATLREILVDDPHEPQALSLCSELLGGTRWREGLLGLMASADSPAWDASDQDARAEVMATCVRIGAQQGMEDAELLPLVERLARVRPGSAEVQAELGRLRSRVGVDDRDLAALRAKVDAAPTDVLRAESLCRLGELHLGRWELREAWHAFERVLTIDPVEPHALLALERIAREPAHAEQLESVLRRRLASLEAGRVPMERRSHAPADLVRLLHEVAELATDDDEALALHTRCLETNPADRAASEEVRLLLARRRDFLTLAVHLDHRLPHAGPAEARAIRKRLAILLAVELEEPSAAIGRWEELGGEDPSDLEPIEALAELHLALDHHTRALELYAEVADRTPPGPYRTEIMRRIARSTRDPAARAVAFRRVLGNSPDDPEALRFLAAHYAERGEGPWALELLLRLASASTDPRECLVALVRASELEADPKRVIAHLQEALEIDPVAVDVLGRLEEAERRRGQWQGVIDALERQLLLASDKMDRLDLAIAIAAVWNEQIHEAEPAARSLERARRIDPRSGRIARQLAALYARMEDWPALARSLRAELDLGPPAAERLSMLLELARINSENLSEPRAAVELYGMAAELAPGRRDLADARIDALAAAGAWGSVVQELESRAVSTVEPAERAAGWHAVAVLCDRAMRRPAAAFDAAVRVARETGPTRSSLRLLLHYATLSGRMQDLAGVLDELSARSPDPRMGACALDLAAQILERDLDAPAGALDRYLEIHRRIGAGPRTAAEIERLALAEGKVEAWVDAELEREKLTDSRTERVAILERVGRVLDSVAAQPERAFDLWLRALEVAPERTDIADQAGALARELDEAGAGAAGSRFAKRLAQLHSKLAASGSWHLERAAELYAVAGDRLAFDGTAALAIATPDDPRPRERLARLARPDRRFGELLAVYDELASLVGDPEERLRIRFEQACLLMDELGRSAPARAILQELLTSRPDLEGLAPRAIEAARASGQGGLMAAAVEAALEGMQAGAAVHALRFLVELYSTVLDEPADAARAGEELLALDPDDVKAQELLLGAYPKLGQWERLVALLWERSGPASARSPSAREAAQAAEIWTNRLGDLERAVLAWRRAVELDPKDPALLGSYSSALERIGDWGELQRVLALWARTATGESTRIEALVQRARVLARKLDDVDSAIDCLEQARGLDPSSPSVTSELERLYELDGRWRDLKLLRSDAADRLGSPEEARDVLVRLSQLCMDHDDADGAVDALWRAIAATPDYVPTYEKLREALRRRGSWGQLVDVLVTESTVWIDQTEAASRLCEAAQIAAGVLHDEDRARQLYKDALGLHDRCRRAAEALADDAERRGNPTEAIGWLEEAKRAIFAADELGRIDRRIERLLARARTRVLVRPEKS
ncbi:MAG: hypothetical protein HYY06_32275 [Deltaproteobacteria bacterium]|nr:hypothetical protein [Deltaproteobacteria bacterium]